MTYDGLEGSKKVKDIFIDEKVPRHKRDSWPILTDETGEILWLVGLRRNTKQYRSAEHSTFLRIKWNKETGIFKGEEEHAARNRRDTDH